MNYQLTVSNFYLQVRGYLIHEIQMILPNRSQVNVFTTRWGYVKHSLKEEFIQYIFLFRNCGWKLTKKAHKFVLQYDSNEEYHTVPLHVYWRHLNSSQVMALNFFMNYVDCPESLNPILTLLGINDEIDDIRFEVVFPKPHYDGTNVDVVLQLKSGYCIFIEVKYTESSIGKATHHQVEYYQRSKNEYHSSVIIDFERYIEYYQLVRMVSLSNKSSNNHSVFLMPKSNSSICESVDSGLHYVNNREDFNTHILYWEDLIKLLPNPAFEQRYFGWRNAHE